LDINRDVVVISQRRAHITKA